MNQQARPTGFCDEVSRDAVVGWAYDPDHPDETIEMDAYVDGTCIATVLCNLARPDVYGSGLAPRSRVGFYLAIPPVYSRGKHVINFQRHGMAVALRDGNGLRAAWELPDDPAIEPVLPIIGHFDPIETNAIKGWAYTPDQPDIPSVLEMWVDGAFVAAFACDKARPDVAREGHPTNIGFEAKLPNDIFDGSGHEIAIQLPAQATRRSLAIEKTSRSFTQPRTVVIGQVDGLQNGKIQGWVIEHDRLLDRKTGGASVLILSQGQPLAQVRSNEFRPDVASTMGCDPNCGFSFVPPESFVSGRMVEFLFRTVPDGVVLAGSPLKVSFATSETRMAIREIDNMVDALFKQLWTLRDRVRRMTPPQTHKIEDYDAWAQQYQRALSARPSALDSLDQAKTQPLISLVCPTYRPRLKDFRAAVLSVIAQTYTKWQLIIVDDASKLPELSAAMDEFKRQDPRIQVVRMRSNAGISEATNAALKRAKGDFVALFDHDDLLSPRALEFMVAAALTSDAQMLYCDEDKIDDDGVFSDVNLKPDWNYRLLLSHNYVCHLVMIDRLMLEQVGGFRKTFDGAQDHDIILRLSEIIPPDRIVHVPLILYHWRKTPMSTASSIGTKQYAVDAGRLAVQDHLKRAGLEGHVRSQGDMTNYEIDLIINDEPSVTIIVPYREHVDMTRACVDAIIAHTDYKNYTLLLIDNWSVTPESYEFARQMEALPNVTVLRVEEPFNYSRINNLAVRRTTSELILFMNNDVFVSTHNWLRTMVGELLLDDRVGIVGNKLLYPEGLFQHGGVILGVGGVADHAHKGRHSDDPGYMKRAMSAQELSAVTAACMLCRRSAFDQVKGFDEVDLRVAFNDIDLCLKIGRAGYKIVWTPSSVAEHRESISRGDDWNAERQSRFFHENEIMKLRWADELGNDPFYHPNFCRNGATFEMLAPREE
jgi:O-antigen biosynthesis protein